jgi:hypothetical protein
MTAIIEITNLHGISVCAARAKVNSYRTAFLFLIYNITKIKAQTLLERRIWSSPAIAFSTSTIDPGCPKYMFSIEGLTTMDNKMVYDTANEVSHDQTFLTFLQRICNASRST